MDLCRADPRSSTGRSSYSSSAGSSSHSSTGDTNGSTIRGNGDVSTGRTPGPRSSGFGGSTTDHTEEEDDEFPILAGTIARSPSRPAAAIQVAA